MVKDLSGDLLRKIKEIASNIGEKVFDGYL